MHPKPALKDLALECQVGLFQLCEKKRQASNFQEAGNLSFCPSERCKISGMNRV